MKRHALLALVIAVALLGLAGCEEDTSGALAGTWYLDSTETPGGNSANFLGDGSFNLTFVMSFEFFGTTELYTGTANIEGIDYVVDAGYLVDFGEVTIELSQTGEDPDIHYIDLEASSYSGGDSFNGTYTGEGDYADLQAKDIDTGTFIATR